MTKKNYFTEFDALLIIFLISVVILSTPHVIRFLSHDSVLIGQEPYYHARIADELTKGRILKQDKLIYGSRPHIFDLYHPILAGFSHIFTLNFASKLVPFLFGILSLLLFYLVLKELKLDLTHRFVTSLILVSCPVFIHTFTLSNPLTTLIFLDLLGLYLLLKQGKFSFVFAIAIFISTIFFGFLPALITLILLLSFVLIKPKKLDYNKIIFILITLAIFSIIYYLPIYAQYGMPQRPDFIQKDFIKNLVSDLGSDGFSLFILLLALVGLTITWKNKYKFVVGYLTIFILFVLLFYFDVAIYLCFIFSVLAGFAFITLIKMKWEIRLIKNLTILILVLGLLFSTLSYLDRISSFPPDKNVVDSLNWLNKNSKEQEVVFSHYSKGFWIEKIAKRPVIMDSMFSYVNANQRFLDLNKTFYSRNLETTKLLLDKYCVKYIWIDQDMKQGLVWTKEEQGLLFLFRNSETFKNVYNKNGIEIWKYLEEE